MMVIDELKVLLANTYAFMLKAQYYHWNIEGPTFISDHNFLGEIYERAFKEIDQIAESIRSLGSYAPGSFGRFIELATIKDEITIPGSVEMFKRLLEDIDVIHGNLMKIHSEAEAEKQLGILNFIEDLIEQNEKTQWMLRSILK